MKNNQEILPFAVILLAMNGDVSALNQVVKHFERYILKLSQKTLFDEFGNPHIHVETEIKRILETKLIVAVLNFELI
ncbi:helix-turn-helix domain-containing protein [Listeria monocytogenes]|uniref:helix-turn-helix domain-containing protein n=1 Tax=Listeria monocytogenes TaxID=1639 RepID=UPI0013AD55F7|nr:helix-turn-helix domain-containing protein [Listeria monocytogenes]EAG8233311.1 helix-turn-helix domain-containing protein [Listeria monocytogenes]EAG8239226.1 helix-turn-helix domain-containing protein [Listeria monocytogenes]EAH0155680.1 helix-turn-helix domain-containing protein [Listeria monocytogenes]EAH1644189.1 helix-turn-helix domain-containing protein [Listeria monocytogenes]EAH3095609.1 helix-turn-helix domain-containing protein [Listeria monocytogenes]